MASYCQTEAEHWQVLCPSLSLYSSRSTSRNWVIGFAVYVVDVSNLWADYSRAESDGQDSSMVQRLMVIMSNQRHNLDCYHLWTFEMAKGLKERYVVLSGVKPRASGLSCQRSAMNNVIHIIQEQCDPHSHSDRVISAREVVVGGCRSSVAEQCQLSQRP